MYIYACLHKKDTVNNVKIGGKGKKTKEKRNTQQRWSQQCIDEIMLLYFSRCYCTWQDMLGRWSF